jgi:zinc protease
MIMTRVKRHFSLIIVLSCLLFSNSPGGAFAQDAAAPLPGTYRPAATPTGAIWPWEGSDLVADPSVTYGQLPNGMRYAIRPNKLPEKQVVLRFRIKAGSKYEREDQRGLSHFIEHMVFNGSTNIPEGELIKTMERLGSSFGSDVNAHVNANEAMYKLDIPSAGEGRLETALKVFRETADRLLFEEAAVKREIGVVMSELNDGDTPFRQVSKRTTEFMWPDDLNTNRSPIGLRPIIEGATPARLREFYDMWYRPDRAILVISGDVDVEATKTLIATLFADWRPKTPVMPPEPNDGSWPKPELRALIQVQPDMPSVVSVTAVKSDEFDYGKLDTQARQQWWLLHGIASDIFDRRLATMQLVDDPPASGVGFNQSGSSNGWTARFYVSPRDQDWERGLRAVAVELRQAMATGFTRSEIVEAVKESRVGYDQAIAGISTRRTPNLAGSVMSALAGNGVYQTPQEEKRLFEEVAATATPENLKEAFTWWWRDVDPAIVLLSKTPYPGGEEAVKAVWRSAMTGPIPPRTPYVRATYVPPNVGAPGILASTTVRPDVDATIARFTNGVTVTFKQTKFSADRVSISVNYGAGALAFPTQDPYWSFFANAAWSGDGVGKLSRDQMITALAGRSTSMASTSVGYSGTSLGISVRKTDMAEQLQVMLSQVREPRLGPRAATLLRDQLKSTWDTIPLTASGMFSLYGQTFFYKGTSSFETPQLARYLASDDAQGKLYLKALLANAPINVTIVGDTTWEEVRAGVAATFGALPPRAGLPPGYDQLTAWTNLPAGGTPRVLRHKGAQTQAITHVSWQTTGGRSLQTSNELNVLGQILQLRLTAKVREEAGDSYSPDGGWDGETLVDKGRLYAHASVTPQQVAPVNAMIDAIARELATTGPTPDEIQRVVGPLIEGRIRARQSNGYWSGFLSNVGLPKSPASPPGDPLVYQANYEARLRAITPRKLRSLAARYLLPSNAIRIQVLPTPVVEAMPEPMPPVPSASTPIG